MSKKRTFTTVLDNQTVVKLPVYQGERVDCKGNELLGEFELTGIPPMAKGEAELEVTFEVDANGMLKVTADEKNSDNTADIEITNSVGGLSSSKIQQMIEDAEGFKDTDKEFQKRFEARKSLESYVSKVEEMITVEDTITDSATTTGRVEGTITDPVERTITKPENSSKLKHGTRASVEVAISDSLAQLEIEDASADDLKKCHSNLKRAMQKAAATKQSSKPAHEH